MVYHVITAEGAGEDISEIKSFIDMGLMVETQYRNELKWSIIDPRAAKLTSKAGLSTS